MVGNFDAVSHNATPRTQTAHRSKRWARDSRRTNNLTRTRHRRHEHIRAYIRRRTRQRPRRMQMPQAIIRRRRPSRVEAKVGVLVVVDNSIYRQYLRDNQYDRRAALDKIKRYYGMVFAMAILIVSLVLKTREDASWLEHIVDWTTVASHGRASIATSNALRLFSGWYHPLLLTLSSTYPGMAYLKAICDTESGNAVSIVGDRGDFQNVKVATHELAHSLGAYHDGYPKATACPPESNYIMTPIGTHRHQVLKNAFYFSRCSIRDMYVHLSNPRSSCVLDEPEVYHRYDLERHPPGHMYTADQQCKLIFGKESQFCNVHQRGSLADLSVTPAALSDM
ncbi:hypothetical protein EGW08_020692 [Elysia chlorotica]|uniref:Peptidase M12B domain-containing protein n=1 Tax=Elysia chlorotica TaxID=188477 RepID=A0A433SQP4_ELYCH|nr:hypothetical protein EGW08_020692 [Elysia chlorotica]